jgi:hypothetical protein
MLADPAPLPDARLWVGALEEPVTVREAIAGDGHALLCFYAFDWSGT